MLGIIGGSGLYSLDSLHLLETIDANTHYGKPSSPLHIASSDEEHSEQNQQAKIAFISRHGLDHSIPPHKINYRANIQSLADNGVTQIISINAVGACNANLAVGQIIMPVQLIDYTYGREHSFFDSLESFDNHIDFTLPFSGELQQRIQATAAALAIDILIEGTYACMQGPRLETAAEVRRIMNDGCDVIGMTAMPEAALARERGIDYISLCIVVNPAAGLEGDSINTEDIPHILADAMQSVEKIITAQI